MDERRRFGELFDHVRSGILLLGSAGLLALSVAPYDLGYAATFALVPWLVVTQRTGPTRALVVGCAFGVGVAILESLWIFDALAAQGSHGVRRIIAVVVIAFWTKGSIFALTGWAVRSFRRFDSGFAVCAPAILFGLLEFRMSHSSWGLPLNLFGHSQIGVHGVAQLAVAVGVSGISTFLFVLNSALARVFTDRAHANRARNRRRALALGVTWFVAAVSGRPISEIFSAESELIRPRRLLAVQPDIPHRERWGLVDQRTILDSISNETSIAIANAANRPDAILWPESLLDVSSSRTDPVRRQLQESVDRWGSPVVMGVVRSVKNSRPNRSGVYRNSVVWWSPVLGPIAWQDKVRAIPVVESGRRVWGHGLFRWLFPESANASRVAEGLIAAPLKGEFTLAPALCFEILFPDLVADRRDEESVAIINLADDSWVKGEVVDRQIIASAAFRAIEQRLTLIRISNGGLSVVIDRFGETVAELPPDAVGHMVVEVRATNRSTTAEKLALVLPALFAGGMVLLMTRD